MHEISLGFCADIVCTYLLALRDRKLPALFGTEDCLRCQFDSDCAAVTRSPFSPPIPSNGPQRVLVKIEIPNGGSSGRSTSTAAIIGAVVGTVALVICCISVGAFLMRRRWAQQKGQKMVEYEDAVDVPHGYGDSGDSRGDINVKMFPPAQVAPPSSSKTHNGNGSMYHECPDVTGLHGGMHGASNGTSSHYRGCAPSSGSTLPVRSLWLVMSHCRHALQLSKLTMQNRTMQNRTMQ